MSLVTNPPFSKPGGVQRAVVTWICLRSTFYASTPFTRGASTESTIVLSVLYVLRRMQPSGLLGKHRKSLQIGMICSRMHYSGVAINSGLSASSLGEEL